MSTKTVAIDSEVYARLASIKGQSESFSKVINRLIERVVTAHTAADVLARLDTQASLPNADAATMEGVVRENRETENWTSHDLS
jgi:predicted CopG family antitoxin